MQGVVLTVATDTLTGAVRCFFLGLFLYLEINRQIQVTLFYF